MTQYTKEPTKTLQLGKTTAYIYSPILTQEEIEERDKRIHKAIANILIKENPK